MRKMDLNDIATVSGKSGLFKIVAPTKGGMILETLDDAKKKMVVNMHSKVSILGEISIYTTDKEGSRPLDVIFKKVHEEFEGDTGLNSSSDPEELKSFLNFILPEYDEDRVYVSDIKKLVNWYALLTKVAPEILQPEDTSQEAEDHDAKDEAPSNTK